MFGFLVSGLVAVALGVESTVDAPLPLTELDDRPPITSDWLVEPVDATAAVYGDEQELVLTNGLIERRWRCSRTSPRSR